MPTDKLFGLRLGRRGGARTEPVTAIDGVWERGGGRMCLQFLSGSWSAVPSPVTREVVRGWLLRTWWISAGLTVLGVLLYQVLPYASLWYVPALVAVGILAAWVFLRALAEAAGLVDDLFGIRRRLRRAPQQTRQLKQSGPQPPRYVIERASISRVWVDQRFLRARITVRTHDRRGVTYRVFGPFAPATLIERLTECAGRHRVFAEQQRGGGRQRMRR